MEKAKPHTKQQIEREMRQIMGGVMVPVQVELFEPFVRFGKEYLAFFGSKESFEIFCMKLIYEGLNRLHRDLTEFVHDKDSPHFIDSNAWFEKHSHLGIVSDQPEDKDS